ncbi:MAG: LPS-assembly protein LptD [Halarcobacter sp.]
MLRIIFTLILLTLALNAKIEKFQVFANNVDTKKGILIANGNVIIVSPTYYISAQKAIYDKNNGTFELFDDVIILKDNTVQVNSEYAFLDVTNNNSYQKPNLFYDHTSSIWINSKESKKTDDIINLDNTILSTCDCIDPDWSIRSSNIDYDTKEKWLNAYNTRIYVKDVPVLYTPYLGFSTDNKRKTGLLIPTFGYSNTEGVSFSQPIFIAPAPNYDVELIPQIRTSRGSGMYAYYRYADSIDSMLNISTGYFKEKKKFQTDNNLRNQEHYGVTLDYEKTNLFTKLNENVDDGLYVSLNYLNDIEFKTLEDKNYSTSNERYIESKINYFYNEPSFYIGSYFRYYIDTQSNSNSNTLQELPKFQIHKYTNPLFFEKLLYSADIKYTNHFRDKGIKANQYEFSIPISYSYSLFDNYLNLVLENETTVDSYDYSNSNINFQNGRYIENRTTIGLNSDLIKPYRNYIHAMNLGFNYNHYDEMKKEGDLYLLTNNNSQLSPFNTTKNEDNIELVLNQSFFDRKTLKRVIKHKLTQSILFDANDNTQLENLTNLIIYNYIWGTMQNRTTYNHQDKKFTESSSDFTFKYKNYNIKLNHYISQKTPNSNREDLHSYSIDARYNIDKKYSLGYYTNYNLEDGIRNKQAFILGIDDSCWSLDLRFEKEITAASTTNQTPIKQDIVYLELMLIPIGGIKQEYELKRD